MSIGNVLEITYQHVVFCGPDYNSSGIHHHEMLIGIVSHVVSGLQFSSLWSCSYHTSRLSVHSTSFCSTDLITGSWF